MRSHFGIGAIEASHFTEMHAITWNLNLLRFPVDFKALRVSPTASELSAAGGVFARAANWLSECIHHSRSLKESRRLSK
jgi:hypothetical protein